MSLLLSMLKKFYSLLAAGPLSTAIDSHKWESKVEILRTLSNRRY